MRTRTMLCNECGQSASAEINIGGGWLDSYSATIWVCHRLACKKKLVKELKEI